MRTENDPAPQKQKCIDIGFSFFMIRRVVVYDANNGENKNSPSPQAVTKTRLSRRLGGLDKHHFRTGTGGGNLFQCSELCIDVA